MQGTWLRMGFCRVLGGDGGATVGILARNGGGEGTETLESPTLSVDYGLRTSCSDRPASCMSKSDQRWHPDSMCGSRKLCFLGPGQVFHLQDGF